MKADKSPAFQWYPKDILSSKRVAMMTLAEEGAYRRALDFCWLHKTLPADPAKLALIIGKNCTVEIATAVSKMFEKRDEELRHSRLDKERIKQKKRSKAQSENGRKGGRPLKNASNLETEEEAETKPNKSDGFCAEKPNIEAKKTFSSSFSSSSSISDINTNTLSPACTVYDLNFFKNQGCEWGISETLSEALNKFLVYRSEHPIHGPEKSYKTVEEIIKQFSARGISDETAAKMIDYTILRSAKNIIFETGEDTPPVNAAAKTEKHLETWP